MLFQFQDHTSPDTAGQPQIDNEESQRWLLLSVLLILFLCPIGSLLAQKSTTEHSVKQRLEKVEEIEEKEEEEDETGKDFRTEKIFGEKFKLNCVLELNYQYLDTKDVDNEDSGKSSDFFVSTAELALRAFLNDWSKAKVVVTAEDVGKMGDKGQVRLDDAILTLKSLSMPLYVVGGKTVLPFGVFEDHLIEGTLTEDLYEINEWGATVGFKPDYYGLDIAFSVYRDPQVIDNLQNFNTHDFGPERQKDDPFRSLIANVTIAPREETLTLSAFYDSEPGDGRRNQSIGGAITVNFWRFILDAEYIAALERERGEDREENKESAAIVGLAFKVIDPLQLVTRYEVFWDDTHGDQDEVLDYRLIAGFNYSLIDWLDVSYLKDATLSFEYRYSQYEKERDSGAGDLQNMVQVQLALGF